MSRTGHYRYRRLRARVIANSDTCALCGKPLTDLPWPDPYSTTADHVIPIADGGHNNGELRAVHNVCNRQRFKQAQQNRHGREW